MDCYFNDCLLGKYAFYLILFDVQNEKLSNLNYRFCCAAEIDAWLQLLHLNDLSFLKKLSILCPKIVAYILIISFSLSISNH